MMGGRQEVLTLGKRPQGALAEWHPSAEKHGEKVVIPTKLKRVNANDMRHLPT